MKLKKLQCMSPTGCAFQCSKDELCVPNYLRNNMWLGRTGPFYMINVLCTVPVKNLDTLSHSSEWDVSITTLNYIITILIYKKMNKVDAIYFSADLVTCCDHMVGKAWDRSVCFWEYSTTRENMSWKTGAKKGINTKPILHHVNNSHLTSTW